MSDQPKTRPGDSTYGPADWTPAYYRGDGLQPFDVIDAFGLDFYEASALKYLLRWRKKNGVQDLIKARTYVQVLIDRHQAEQPAPPESAELETVLRGLPGIANDPDTIPAILRAVQRHYRKDITS